MPLNLWVTNVCQLLGYCGLTSIRMFLPTFLYFLVLRLSIVFPKYFPAVIIETGSRVPSWQTSTVFLSILGILAVAEMVAMRCPELKKFLTDDFDKIAKPLLTVLVLSGVISAQQQAATHSILGTTCQVYTAAFLSVHTLWALLGGGLTYLYCRIRSSLYSLIYSIDPDGSLGILKFVNSGEEILLVIGFLLIVFSPLLALIILLVGGIFSYAARKVYAMIDKAHSHPCPECEKNGQQTIISDSAVICPVCGSKQQNICRLGFLGVANSKKVMDQDLPQHVFDLQKSKRCRSCASILKKGNVCEKCGTKQWSPETIAYFKQQMRKREIIFAGVAILAVLYPLIAFLFFLVSFNFFLIRPYAAYLDYSQNFVSRFIFTVLKIIFVVLMLFLSTIPLIGILALLPFLFRYLFVRKEFYRNIA